MEKISPKYVVSLVDPHIYIERWQYQNVAADMDGDTIVRKHGHMDGEAS